MFKQDSSLFHEKYELILNLTGSNSSQKIWAEQQKAEKVSGTKRIQLEECVATD